MKILLKDVPKWIQESETYETFLENGSIEDEIDISINLVKNLNINSKDDFIDFCKIYEYWGLKLIPQSFYIFSFENKDLCINIISSNFVSSLSFVLKDLMISFPMEYEIIPIKDDNFHYIFVFKFSPYVSMVIDHNIYKRQSEFICKQINDIINFFLFNLKNPEVKNLFQDQIFRIIYEKNIFLIRSKNLFSKIIVTKFNRQNLIDVFSKILEILKDIEKIHKNTMYDGQEIFGKKYEKDYEELYNVI